MTVPNRWIKKIPGGVFEGNQFANGERIIDQFWNQVHPSTDGIEYIGTGPDGLFSVADAKREIKQLKRSYFLGNPELNQNGYEEMVQAAIHLSKAEFKEYYTAVIYPEVMASVEAYKAHAIPFQEDQADRELFIQRALDSHFKENISEQSDLLHGYINKVDWEFDEVDLTNTIRSGDTYINNMLANAADQAEADTIFKFAFDPSARITATNAATEKNTAASAMGYLGLNEDIEKHIPSAILSAARGAGFKTPLEKLEEAAAVMSDEDFDAAIQEITGKKVEITDKLERYLRQCALFIYFLKNHKDKPDEFNPPNKMNYLSGRVLPVDPYNSPIDPDTFINRCTVPNNIQSKLFDIFTNQKNKLSFDLFWVYSDKSGGKNTLKEVQINLAKSKYKKQFNELKQKRKDEEGMTDSQRNSFDLIKAAQKSLKTNHSAYTAKEIKITLEGQDPATSRTDLKVDLRMEIESLASLNAACAIADVGGSFVAVTLKDLITLPNVQTVESRDAAGALKNSYHPDYSRVRLKVYPEDEKRVENAYELSHMILDLTTIGHDISVDSETKKTTLTINYRGYFEQSLNMPYNDALASIGIIKGREERSNELAELTKEGNCSTALLRDKLRADREVDRLESNRHLEDGGFIQRIAEGLMLRKYTENSSEPLKGGIVAGTLDPRGDYITKISRTADTGAAVGFTTARDTLDFEANDDRWAITKWFGSFFSESELTKKAQEQNTLEFAKQEKHCFFLGDLLELITDCLYEDNTADHRSYVKNLNMKFIASTIKLPYPHAPADRSDQRTTIINPLQIPIDFGFFMDWFYESFSRKGISSYPVGPFLRDFLEKLINDVLYDVCYSFLLPDEVPPQLSYSFFIDNSGSDKFFKSNRVGKYFWFNPRDPYGDGSGVIDSSTSTTGISEPAILMPTSVNADVGTSRTYCCIYQKTGGNFRAARVSDNVTLKDSNYIPTIYNGVGMNNYITDVSFSKTDVPFLRESKYFNNSFGLISLLANVYDLSFKFQKQHANTLFFPGMIFNFIVTDFMNLVGADSFKPKDHENSESDPHKDKTLANVLGFGGYYVVTKVEYTGTNIANDKKSWDINITSKFFGTDANVQIQREAPEEKSIEKPDSSDCKQSYNKSAIRVNITSATTGADDAQEFPIL